MSSALRGTTFLHFRCRNREDQGVGQGREAGEVARGVGAAGKADHQGEVETAVGVPHEAGGLREVRLQPRLPGMPALLTGITKQKHTPQCRQRMEKEMGELERVKNAKPRRE